MTFLIIGVLVMMGLMAGGLWIAFSIGVGAVIALSGVMGLRVFDIIGMQAWSNLTGFVLTAVPLFLLMGELLSGAGLIRRLYSGLAKMIAGVPGGLVQTNIAACTIFAAATGSSIVGASAMGRIAYPEMKQKGYDEELSVGSIAAGGTLGILIPPSIPLIIYGDMSNQSVGQLFMAGVIPGLVLSAIFMVFIAIKTLRQPFLVPKESIFITTKIRLSGFIDIWPFLILVLIVLGTIYGGIATPTEAAAIGAVGSFFLGFVYREMSWRVLRQAALNTVKISSLVLLIYVSANLMAQALAYYGVSSKIGEFALSIGSRGLTLAAICIMYLILGCFFDALSMMLITLPFLLPALKALHFDLVWFGILLVILMEIGYLTPPVGMNLFVLQGVTGVPLKTVVRGSFPFILLMTGFVFAIIFFPEIVVWLPSRMANR